MSPSSPPTVARRDPWSGGAVTLVLIALLVAFQFADIGSAPMHLWDESRLAVNAIEMLISGDRLTTSFGFAPDLWNTKPPLLVNLMASTMTVFGPGRFALRLPSALAMVATAILVGWLVRRLSGSPGCGFAAGALLAVCPLFYGAHAGATGDYDALLTLWTTAYGLALFVLIDRGERDLGLAAAAGLFVGLAILTKGVAGLVPGIGVAIYALVVGLRRLPQTFVNYVLVVGVAVLVGGSYYFLRAQAAPGYVAAVMSNELGGRFGGAIENHGGSAFYFIRRLLVASPGIFFIALAGLALLPDGRARRLAIFALFQVTGLLVVYSSAQTKLPWYIVPALPFLAIAVALGGLGILHRAAGTRFARAARIAAVTLTAAAIGFAIWSRYIARPEPMGSGAFKISIAEVLPPSFDRLIAAAVAARAVPLTVVDPGVGDAQNVRGYAPSLRFYRLVAQRQGINVSHATRVVPAPFLGSCDPTTRAAVTAAGHLVWRSDECVLVAR